MTHFKFSGGCQECGGVCGGASNPHQLMEMVLQHAEDGNITGGEIANIINEYTHRGMHGAGFFSSLWHGIKKVASVAGPILSALPQTRAIGSIVSAVGNGKRRRGRPRKMEFCNIENIDGINRRICKTVKRIHNKPVRKLRIPMRRMK